ncbi:HIT-like domain,Cwf19-like, C-terminal domain-1 [Cinara cedri]|uniref:HIT-like domain,Cwf19-like, C-terminal domain-1 n=1 Tax=Cinara cedri TaxID=506608 RepID=A0A5E4M5V2_9HEMI|nr:HIT-like domain,Cwf19-like, C-terminal domain-1 [Cinara cedri]
MQGIQIASNHAYKIQKFKEKRKQTIEGKTDVCLLCLFNQTLANKQHMVVSTNDQVWNTFVYLAGNKGPLIKVELLIATVGHYKSFHKILEKAQLEVNV